MSKRQRALDYILNSDLPVTMQEMRNAGFDKATVYSLVRHGEVENPSHGVYRKPDVEGSVYAEWALLSLKYPQATICLLSAAVFHGMTQELPWKLTVAMPRDAGRPPVMGEKFGVEIDTLLWRNNLMLELGVDKHVIDGVTVNITSPERTLVDLFRYSTFNSSMRDSAVRITDEMFLESLDRCNSENMGHFSFETVASIARSLKCYEGIRPYTKTVRYIRSEIPSL